MKQALAFALAQLVLVTTATAGFAAEPQTKDQPKQKDGGYPDLVGGLKATPGCLGVETARTDSGKQVIFAWFEDKKAVLKWYHSDVHREVDEADGRPIRDEGSQAAGRRAGRQRADHGRRVDHSRRKTDEG